MTASITAKKKSAIGKTCALYIIALAALVVTLTSSGSAWGITDLLLMPSPKLPNEMAMRAVYLDLTLAGNRLVAVGEYGVILYSDNGGTTWQQADVPTSVTLTSVHFPTAQKGWAVGHDGVVLNSTDAGQSWHIQLSGLDINKKALDQIEKKVEELTLKLDSADEAESKILGNRLENMELLISDMRVPVEDKSPTSLMDVLFLDEQKGFAVGAFGMIIQTTDGGENWSPIVDKMDNIYGLHYYGIECLRVDNQNVLFLVGEKGLLMRSTDGAETWHKLESPYDGTFFGVAGSMGEKKIVVFGLGGKAFLSDDLGEKWRCIQSDSQLALSGAAQLLDGDLMLISSNGNLFRVNALDNNVSPVSEYFPGSMAAADTGGGIAVVAGIGGIKQVNILVKKGE